MKNVKIQKGSIVKIWHNPKGLEYIVVSVDTENKKLGLLKANCLNKDGTIHKSTSTLHKLLDYSELGGKRIVKGITGINRRFANVSTLRLDSIRTRGTELLSSQSEFISSINPTS